MGKKTTEDYPWNEGNKDGENDILSRCSLMSVSRSTSEGYSRAPDSPRAVDAGDLEAQVVLSEKHAYLTEGYEKRQSILREQATNKYCIQPDLQARSGPASPPRTIRWTETQPYVASNTSASSRSLGSWISSSTATSIPPPPALRSSRRLSLPGAFPVAGMHNNGYSGEEEKFEDEVSIWPSSESDEPVEEILVEATLVSEKSNEDEELSSSDFVFQAEPLDPRRIFNTKSICCTFCLLLVIAVFGVAAGTELGRRKYEESPQEATPPRDPEQFVINNSSMTFVPTSSIPLSYSGYKPDQGMQAPPQHDTVTTAPTPFPSTLNNNNSITDFVRDVLPDKTRMSLEDPESPQSLAYEWLSNDPNLERRSMMQQLQRFALASLYYSMNGDAWENRGNWLSYEVEECLWSSDAPSGLVCSADQDNHNIGRYEILSINDKNNLRGTLPDELWLLTTLVSIQLYEHDLNGTIPTRVGKMPYLETLLLFDLSIHGSIPKEIGMTQLKSLHLGGNFLSGEIPSEVGKIEELRYLYLNDNLFLNGTLPKELGQLSNLNEFALQNNSLSGPIPSELGALTNLQMAHLAYNSLTGTVPDQLAGLVNLKALVLQSNYLTGTIPDLSGLSQLEFAFFGLNNLTGTIPEDNIEGWASLMVLDMGNNDLSGTIPVVIGQLEQLQVIDLFNNSLSGSIPEQLGRLYHLEKVMLEKNQLTGTIPSSLGSLTNLKRLWLHDNEGLTGSVPLSVCKLVETKSLESLSVDCHRVACGCGCDCSRSSSQVGLGSAAEMRKQGGNNGTSLWDEVVEFVTNLFD